MAMKMDCQAYFKEMNRDGQTGKALLG